MKVLFITASRIGDAVLTTGVLNYLTHKPGIELSIAAGPVAMPLFEDWPHVVERYTLIKKGSFNHWVDLWKKTRSTSWDWVIDLRGSLFSWSVRTKRRSVWKKPSQVMHRVEAMAQVADLSSVPAPYLHIAPTRYLQNNMQPYVVVAPAANWLGKEWPLERYISLLKRLLQGPLQGWKVLILAAPEEYSRLEPLVNNLDPSVVLPIDTKRSLLDSAALMKQAALFIGNDSGLMHMAAALDVPTVGLFGPSPYKLYDPYGPHGLVVRTPCPYEDLLKQRAVDPKRCFMESLSVEAVYKAVCNHGYDQGLFPCVA